MLGRLAEAGLEIAMALERRAKAAEPEEGAGDPSIDLDAVALGYSRVSRAVRLCILLQSRLIEGPEKSAKAKGPQPDPAKLKADVLDVMEQVAEAVHGEGDGAERLKAECAERLDSEPWDALMDRPIEDILADICGGLGIDWPLYRTHPWVHHVLQQQDSARFWAEGRYELIWGDRDGKPMYANTFEGHAEWTERVKAEQAAASLPEPADSG